MLVTAEALGRAFFFLAIIFNHARASQSDPAQPQHQGPGFRFFSPPEPHCLLDKAPTDHLGDPICVVCSTQTALIFSVGFLSVLFTPLFLSLGLPFLHILLMFILHDNSLWSIVLQAVYQNVITFTLVVQNGILFVLLTYIFIHIIGNACYSCCKQFLSNVHWEFHFVHGIRLFYSLLLHSVDAL